MDVSDEGVQLKSTARASFFNRSVTLGSALIALVVSCSAAAAGPGSVPTIEASRTLTKDSSREGAGLCAAANRRKVELHPELPKGDGSFVLLCGSEALFVRGTKILHRLPIHITWDGNADKMPVHPAVKHMDFGSRDIVTVQVDSAGDSVHSKICAQILSVYRSELLAGPGFCRTADSPVKQISAQEHEGEHDLLVTTIESGDAAAATPSSAQAGTAEKANLVVNEVWSWHRTEWRLKPKEKVPARAKYGKDVTLLGHDHEFMRESEAPDYWALSPYYVAQKSDSACSIASVSMVVNASLIQKNRGADEELPSQSELIKDLQNDAWRAAVIQGGPGITLDQLKAMLDASLKLSGLKGYTIQVVHTAGVTGELKAQLHKSLIDNEASDRNFMIANFSQGAYTGDVAVGHMAPVGAYDEKRKRVLIMDPDRQWYEPYWVSEEVFLKGMATTDKVSGKARGYLLLKLATAEQN